ncbi:OLC1v1020325C1 [Oldenlandia corymbosa var. corymbosa]|uniref:OLC1v1020325C1 n=1 Tax=Oldenlandia corymbosa var. corymbosa TaxID=529605 RepID=A0AAV1EGA2_OLDCO|nr:OLC1v1020325C1 [Oldenlandia corymbosa var. corymbosa]
MINSLPDDLALKVALHLEASDVCSLGSCSRFWRELCGSDFIWEDLCRERWVAINWDSASSAHGSHSRLPSNWKSNSGKRFLGWKAMYVKRHKEMAGKAALIFDFVDQCLTFDSIEIGYHLKAVQDMSSMFFEFEDVQINFLRTDANVLLNLIGLHYCITILEMPAESLTEALRKCKVSERQVCVKWWKLGRLFYGFRLRDELLSRTVSLEDLASSKENEVLGVLQRGAIHEVLRVKISAAKPECVPWSCQIAESGNL